MNYVIIEALLKCNAFGDDYFDTQYLEQGLQAQVLIYSCESAVQDQLLRYENYGVNPFSRTIYDYNI